MIERLNPKPTEHPVFEPPPPDTTLWRYMDLARFIALLERRALFFSSIHNFSDRFEGALTPSLIAEVQGRGEHAEREWRGWNSASFVNCWNEEGHESAALWHMYTSPSGGVAIKSSVDSILSAVESDTQEDELYIGRVRYDYTSQAAQSVPADNAFWPLVHKREAYGFEHEVRLVIWPQRLVANAQAMWSANPSRAQTWVEFVPEVAPLGYDVGVDPNLLIEGVVVAPEAPGWLFELVQAVCVRYGLDAPVSPSDLDSDPP